MSRSLKGFTFLLFIFVSASAGFAFSPAGPKDQITYQFNFSEDDLIFDKEGSFDRVSLKKGVRIQNVGAPDLPLKLIHLILPQDANAVSVSVIDGRHLSLLGEYLIPPHQLDEKTDGSLAGEWIEPDPVIYSSDSSYPGKLVELIEDGYLGGDHLVTLALYPLQYRPKSGQLFFYTQMTIRVEWEGSNRVPLSSSLQRRSTRAQKMNEEMVYQLVANKDDIPKFMYRNFLSGLFKANVDTTEYYSYLIVTSSQLKSAFLPLAEWKTKKGVKTTIVCIDTILSTYPGIDDAEKLRNFLIQAYQNGTTWVLLGGDEQVVPIRYAYPTNTSTTPPISDQQICDLYFSDVDGEWDKDGDGIWGEPQQDHPDLYPDLFVGRVPCSDTTEVKAFVEKLLSYEKNPGNGSPDYLIRALWMCSDQMRDWNSGNGQHNLVAPFMPSNFTQDLSALIESPSGSAENPISPYGETCIEKMNQGWGIIGVLAHGMANGFVAKSNLTNGSPKSWVFATPGADDEHGHLPNLGNDQKYGIMYSIACSQSAIDGGGEQPCVGEFYPLAHQKGGVAFLGYSRWGWVSLSYLLFEKFLEYSTNGNPEHHIGIAEALSRCAYPSYRDINYGHNLFGDPEMSVWTEQPEILTAIHPDGVSMGHQIINFSVTSQGAVVPDALICLSLRERIMFLGKTDQQGHLSAEMNLDDVGEMSVVVTKPNFIPYQDSITISLSADVDEEGDEKGMKSFELSQNYPNPFNPVTTIPFTVHSPQSTVYSPITATQRKTVYSSQFTVHSPIHTTLKIYNILGQLVRTLVNENKMRGNYQVIWDGKDSKGNDVSSGIYFYTLEIGNLRKTKKMTLVK